jgi:Transposase IS66 family
LKPLSHRSQRRVSVTERKPYAVVSDPHRYRTGLAKLPSHRSIYRLTEPSEGPSLEGCRVKKPAGTIPRRSEEGEVLMAQVPQSHWPAAVAERVAQIIRMYFWVVFALQEAKLSVKRLRNWLFGSRAQPKARPASEVEATSSEAPGQAAGAEEAALVEEVAPRLETTGCEAGSGASESEAKPKPTGGHRAGTGRLGADAYVGAERTECRHADWAVGQRCPVCGQGTFYELPPGVAIRIDGQALLSALRYELHKLRCSAWGQIVTASLPPEAGEEKDSPRARAVLVVGRYYLGLPLDRIAGYQAMLGVPIPDATQWDQIERVADGGYGVFQHLEGRAAQGELIHQDATAVRIVTLIKANQQMRAPAAAQGCSRPKERPGMFTTAWVVKRGERTICLYDSGRSHAGENLQVL